jgi:CHAD domain-containing protein
MTQPDIALNPNETLKTGLVRVVDALIGSVMDRTGNSSQNCAPLVHDVRTTIKRLRALLRLIRPAVSQGFFDRENTRLKAAAARLAFARDAEVARETLKSLPISKPSEQEAVAAALAGFDAKVEAPKYLDQAMADVRRDLEQTKRNFHRLRLRGTERDVVEGGLLAVYRQGRKRMGEAVDGRRDNAFHRWRIRAKNLYYELQFLESVWPKRFCRMVSRLSKLEDKIGLDHDLAILRAWLPKTPESFGGTEAVHRVIFCLDNETRKLRRITIPLGRKIWEEKPRRFARKVGRHWRRR